MGKYEVKDTSGETVFWKEQKKKPIKKPSNKKPIKLAGGGRATHGYGRAYMKGGRAR